MTQTLVSQHSPVYAGQRPGDELYQFFEPRFEHRVLKFEQAEAEAQKRFEWSDHLGACSKNVRLLKT
jgi:hypothetical protein